jgi:hypothetical protein
LQTLKANSCRGKTQARWKLKVYIKKTNDATIADLCCRDACASNLIQFNSITTIHQCEWVARRNSGDVYQV